MNKSYWSNLLGITFGLTTTCFSFIPDSFFSEMLSWTIVPEYWNDTINRLVFLVFVAILTGLGMLIWRWSRKKVKIRGYNYDIVVEYGNIFDVQDSRKVINFDECFTTELGDAPHQIKRSSVCGQFLENNPGIDIRSIISNSGIKPKRGRSKYNNQECYESGRLLLDGDYLLMAFAKLNKDGRAEMTREEYVESLRVLWEEIDKYYSQTDISIPILGSGITGFNGELLNKQQLVDIIIASYQVNPHKIKKPNSLRIICKKDKDFSLDNIGNTLLFG